MVYQREIIDVGLAGIALTLASILLEYIYWLMRQSTAVDMHFDAVQHINEFIAIPQEPPGVIEGSRPPAAVNKHNNNNKKERIELYVHMIFN